MSPTAGKCEFAGDGTLPVASGGFMHGFRFSRGLIVVAMFAVLFVLAACTAVVVDDPYVYRPAPPPPAVIVLPGETYGSPPPDRNRINRRLTVCNANYNNCLVSCNALPHPSQKALCTSQCNAAFQQCQQRSVN